MEADPTDDWGVVKSRGIPAGVMMNQTGEWNGPVIGKYDLEDFGNTMHTSTNM